MVWSSCCRPMRDDQAAELARWRQLFLASAALTIPVWLVAMVLPMLPGLAPVLEARILGGFPLDEVVKWAFATPVQFYIGWRFHAGAWNALRNGRCARMHKIPSVFNRTCMHTVHAEPGTALLPVLAPSMKPSCMGVQQGQEAHDVQ